MDLFDVLLIHLGINLLLCLRWNLTGTKYSLWPFLTVAVLLGWTPSAFESLTVRIVTTVILGLVEIVWIIKNLQWVEDHCADHTIRSWNSPEFEKYTTK